MIKLGSEVKDIVSGFAGVATVRSEYLNGCVRYAVDPGGLDKDGKPKESFYFDEQQLVVVSEVTETTKHLQKEAPRSVGGPRPAPVGRAEPPARRAPR